MRPAVGQLRLGDPDSLNECEIAHEWGQFLRERIAVIEADHSGGVEPDPVAELAGPAVAARNEHREPVIAALQFGDDERALPV